MAFSEDSGGGYTPPEPPSAWPSSQKVLSRQLDAFLTGQLSLAPQFLYTAEITAIVPAGCGTIVGNTEYPNEKVPLKSDGVHCFGRHRFMCGGRQYEVAVVIQITTGEAIWRWLKGDPDASTRRIVSSAALHRKRK